MSVSPADFELYSRVTGTPLPRTAAEQMRLAPQVFNFIRNQQYAQQEPNNIQRAVGGLGKLALAGGALAGLYGLSQVGKNVKPPYDEGGGDNQLPPPPGGPNGNGDLPPSKEERQHQHQVDYYDSPEYLDNQAMEAIGRDDYREETFGIPGARQLPSTESSIDRGDLWGGDQTTIPNQTGGNLVLRAAGNNSLANNTSTVADGVSDNQNLVPDAPSSITQVVDGKVQQLESGPLSQFRQALNRPGPITRTEVEGLREQVSSPFSVVKSAPSLLNPTGRRVEADVDIVGTDQSGDPIRRQPRASFTEKPLQFPYPNRTNPGAAFIAASTDAPNLGIPGLDNIHIPVVSGLTGFEIPGASQLVTTAGPYIAGLSRQAAGDVSDTLRFGGAGISALGRNLPTILAQGRADIGKGVRDVQTGVSDVQTFVPLLLDAANKKRQEDVRLLQEGVGTVQKAVNAVTASKAYKALPGTGKVETGIESDIGDNPQTDDPEQSHEQYSVSPSRSGQGQRLEELKATFAKSLAHLPPDQRDAMAESMLRGKTEGGGIVGALKSGWRGLTGPLEETWEDTQAQKGPSEIVTPDREVRSDRIMGKEARYAAAANQIANRMDYNPGAPKLPGDEIQIGDDKWGKMTINPSKWLRNRDLPDSAYDQYVPKESEETPLWWDV